VFLANASWGTHAAPIRGHVASVTCLIWRCVRGMRRNLPSPSTGPFAPPSPPPMVLGIVRGFLGTMQPSDSRWLPPPQSAGHLLEISSSTPLAAPVRPLSGLYVLHGWPGAGCRPRGCKAAQEALSQATVDRIVCGEPSAWLLSQTASSRSSARWCAAWPTGRPRGRALRAKVECKFQ
jgi:hypothetical protein